MIVSMAVVSQDVQYIKTDVHMSTCLHVYVLFKNKRIQGCFPKPMTPFFLNQFYYPEQTLAKLVFLFTNVHQLTFQLTES